ncbi:hypothetical protein Pmar_PMAR001760 [Perkinsus marinus ATCC 50983]|uniref:Uncharacterized protein n=1 Tax=Perkinsus marinus (strain ATCC 50983 / TXsc) TaxID=423536 RepID=C5LS83_PERM5|nr:hypothetical protein Pmar_PMAR001760 [Perkinsus marinus ATCC 50983]EER00410.1 hypothetical protein Pmar_PMAR001760 [Perkinsus marinus ATCC 50983]|eukprot:XP_002767692.1 hypothetical protein Pmar_PMAR001760 [Perkinsus marinus ATCC 50983]
MGAVLDDDAEAEQPQADVIAVRLRRARVRAALIAAASQKEDVVKAKFSVDAILVSAAQLFGCLPNNELVPFPHVAEVLSRDRYSFIEFKTYPEITAAASKSVIQFTPDGQAVETAKLPTGKPPTTFEQWLPLMLRWAFTIYVLEGKGDLIHVCEYAARIASISNKHGFGKAQVFDRRYRQRMLLCMRRLQSSPARGEVKMEDHQAFSTFLAKNLEPELLAVVCLNTSPMLGKPNALGARTMSKVVWEGTCRFTKEGCPYKDCKFAKHLPPTAQQKNTNMGKRVINNQGQGPREKAAKR